METDSFQHWPPQRYWPPVMLAVLDPSLRDQIDEVTGLAWLTVTGLLRDVSNAQQLAVEPAWGPPESSRITYHLDLRRTYIASVGSAQAEPRRRSEREGAWDVAPLRQAYENALRALAGTPSRARERVPGALDIYEAVAGYVAGMEERIGPDLKRSVVTATLDLADACLEIMTQLEGTHVSPVLSESV